MVGLGFKDNPRFQILGRYIQIIQNNAHYEQSGV